MPEEKYINQGASECLSLFFSLCDPIFRGLTAKEIETESGFKADKVYRYLKTLEHKNMVRKVGERWECSPGIVRIADGYRRNIAQKRAEIEVQEREYLG
jgi:DNA-binding IclR family transcriptional regulator